LCKTPIYANSKIAHTIRRQVTTFFKAVADLKAKSRWCLTGTPIQNKLDDVGSLFAFIQAHPFHNIAMFRRFISTPFDESQKGRECATRDLTLLLDSLCLRRSRELLHLPAPQHILRSLEFSAQEREQYNQTINIMNRALRLGVGESYRKNIFGMFQVQLQLRIFCNHGTYQRPFSWNNRSQLDEKEDALCSVGDDREVHCSACRQSMSVMYANDLYRTYPGRCAHIICNECLDPDEETGGKRKFRSQECPLCGNTSGHSPDQQLYPPQEESGNYLRHEGFSTKMEALIKDVRHDLWETKR
jgi:SWI/SNF-related matrix-associated actin-dependent regulator of chromatin subfamily A3